MNTSFSRHFATITLFTAIACSSAHSGASASQFPDSTVEDFNTVNDNVIASAQTVFKREELLQGVKESLPHVFTNEQVMQALDTFLAKNTDRLSATAITSLIGQRKQLANKLREYRVTGFSWSLDWNFAWFYNNQRPRINVAFKNNLGQFRYREFWSEITSVGFKLQFAYKLNLIFVTDTDFNFYDSNKVIELGSGIDLSASFFWGLDITYADFLNAPGGLLVVGIPLFGSFPGISLVTGGRLVPLN